MKIHFICLGNTFRSRLAEAYAKKTFPNFDISSSGIEANRCLNGHITWYAQWVAQTNGIADMLHSTWRQTEWSDVNKNDIIVCFAKQAEEEALRISNDKQDVLFFDVADVQEQNGIHPEEFSNELSLLHQAQRVFDEIKQAIDIELQRIVYS